MDEMPRVIYDSDLDSLKILWSEQESVFNQINSFFSIIYARKDSMPYNNKDIIGVELRNVSTYFKSSKDKDYMLFWTIFEYCINNPEVISILSKALNPENIQEIKNQCKCKNFPCNSLVCHFSDKEWNSEQ